MHNLCYSEYDFFFSLLTGNEKGPESGNNASYVTFKANVVTSMSGLYGSDPQWKLNVDPVPCR